MECAFASSFLVPAAARRAARRRVCKALAASIVLHFAAALTIRGGSPALMRDSALPSVLEARLVDFVPPDQPDSVHVEAQRIEPAPRRSAPDAVSPMARKHAVGRSRADAQPANAADTRYYSVREIDLFPAPIVPLELHYPATAAAARIAGYALLAVVLDAKGLVTDVKVLESEPAGVFDDGAVQAIVAARFSPALKDGRAVRSRITVKLTYSAEADR